MTTDTKLDSLGILSMRSTGDRAVRHHHGVAPVFALWMPARFHLLHQEERPELHIAVRRDRKTRFGDDPARRHRPDVLVPSVGLLGDIVGVVHHEAVSVGLRRDRTSTRLNSSP